MDPPRGRVETAFPVVRLLSCWTKPCLLLFREVMITYVDPTVTFEQLCSEMREICRFGGDQVFTMKWVDEEGEFVDANLARFH